MKKVGGVETVTRYYFFNGQRIAQKVGTGALTYLHSDHLGSTVLTTGVAGNKKYYAYGSTRSGSVPTDVQFTGQMTSTTGLVYMHARYYDPATGAFISPDTIIPDPGSVFDYNRYMYARGNPLKYNDPSGHDPLDAEWREAFFAAHGFYPDNIDEAIRLFSVAFPGEWDERLFYGPDGARRDYHAIRDIFHDTSRRDWAGLGQALDSLSGWYKDNETAQFAQDIAFLFAGTRSRSQRGSYLNGHYGDNLDAWLGRGGLPEMYFDRPGNDDEDHNVHHWAWAFALGYVTGSRVGSAINAVREQWMGNGDTDMSDILIGSVGASMGGTLQEDPSRLRTLSEMLYADLCWQP